MAFENFCGIQLATLHFFFFIIQFEKGLVWVSWIPVAARRSVAIECPNHEGIRTAQMWLLISELEGEGCPQVKGESEDARILELWLTTRPPSPSQFIQCELLQKSN